VDGSAGVAMFAHLNPERKSPMNFFTNIKTWFTHTAWPSIESFFGGVVADELPLAEQVVSQVIAQAPEIIDTSKPLVSLGNVTTAAAKSVESQAISVGVNAIAVAATNAISAAQTAAAAAAGQPAATQQSGA
jgi:hypothetical protein